MSTRQRDFEPDERFSVGPAGNGLPQTPQSNHRERSEALAASTHDIISNALSGNSAQFNTDVQQETGQ